MVVRCGASIGDVDPVGAVGPYVEPTSVDFDHLVDGVRDGHAAAVLAASIFHFGEYSIREAKDYMAGAGLAMRLDA